MPYTTRFDDALVFASDLHRHQTRKGTDIPYVTHLLAVAALVGTHGGTEDQVIGGLLHDAIEDCIAHVPDVRARIDERFGPDVLAIVEACTDADTDPKPPWRARKEAYLAHLRQANRDAPFLLVSLADKVHNARSIVADLRTVGDALWDRFNAGRDGSLWYYASLAETFGTRHPGPRADELADLVRRMHRM